MAVPEEVAVIRLIRPAVSFALYLEVTRRQGRGLLALKDNNSTFFYVGSVQQLVLFLVEKAQKKFQGEFFP